MKKPYEGHEAVYREMRKKGILSWDQRDRPEAVEGDTVRFLEDVLSQVWAPKSGRAIELGCGTGPILRWVHARGFECVGVDVSRTAIEMAKKQSKGMGIRFRRADLCGTGMVRMRKFDLVVDGHCLHCITNARDRRAFLASVVGLLKERGVLVVMTMCGPLNREVFSRIVVGGKLYNRISYVPCEKASRYEGFRRFGGQGFIPSRYLGHWRNILREIREAGFRPMLIRLSRPTLDDPASGLMVGAVFDAFCGRETGKR